MTISRLVSVTLAGLSFSLAELALARSWSDANSMRMTIRLDHGCDANEFEEVLTFHIGDNLISHWMMWRDSTTVYVESMSGNLLYYNSLAEALEELEVKQPVVVTDINAPAWPA